MPRDRVLLLLALSVFLPCCLLLCLLNNVLPVSVGPVSPLRWLITGCLPPVMAGYGLKRGSLDVTGAAAGILLSQVMILASYGFLAQLMTFFLVGSKITRFRQHLKEKIEEDYKPGGGRDWLQVLCTGGCGGVLSWWWLVECGSGDRWLDPHQHYHAALLSAAVLGSLSCACGDTFSSELGTVLGSGDPLLITTLRPVPRGTNGGISVPGTLASALGGALVGVSHYLALWLCLPFHTGADNPSQYCFVWLGAVGGLVGSVLDSLLGATLQYSGVSHSGHIVSQPAPGVRHISGRPLLTNQEVNFVTGVMTSLLLPALVMLLY